jgi:magnesium chelatase family protein
MMVFPTRFMLVAASNPCPCGLGDNRCQCSQADLVRHRRRLSGPLLDRIDILMRVERPPAEALRVQIAPASAQVRERVIAARERQLHRLADHPEVCNAQLTSRQIREVGRVTASALRLLGELYDRHSLSARGHTRILRVARTVADLDASEVVNAEHVNIAASLRLDDTHQLAEAA